MHAYTFRLQSAIEALRPRQQAGTVAHVHVSHDHWCASHGGQDCNCDADICVHLIEEGGRDAFYDVLRDGSVRAAWAH
jgi:hypothetical protein